MTEVLHLRKTILDLSKAFDQSLQQAGFLEIPTMTTRLATDRSGSMREEFQYGWVSHTIDLFLAAAMRFDDDGILEMAFFNRSCEKYPDATVEDAGCYLSKNPVDADGGTSFAPVIRKMAHTESTSVFSRAARLFGVQKAATLPVYMGMITDGECDDGGDFLIELERVNQKDTFIQIIGIGNEVDVSFLKSIAAKFVNVDFRHIESPHSCSAEDFLRAMSNDKFREWLAHR